MSQVLPSSTNLLIKVFPVVLSHESEKSQEGPAEGVKAGVAVVWITASFDTYETLWTEPANTHRYTLNTTCLCLQRYPLEQFVQVNIHLKESFTNFIQFCVECKKNHLPSGHIMLHLKCQYITDKLLSSQILKMLCLYALLARC